MSSSSANAAATRHQARRFDLQAVLRRAVEALALSLWRIAVALAAALASAVVVVAAATGSVGFGLSLANQTATGTAGNPVVLLAAAVAQLLVVAGFGAWAGVVVVRAVWRTTSRWSGLDLVGRTSRTSTATTAVAVTKPEAVR